MSADPMLPLPYRVTERTVETPDSVTLRLDPVGERLSPARPGQFCMLYARGIGEIALSVSGVEPGGALRHTVRDVGAVSRAVHDAGPGAVLGVRGPFGTDWALDAAAGADILVVAGGVGLAPLYPVVTGVLARRGDFGTVTLVAGARAPQEFLYRAQLARWASGGDLDVHLTVDRPARGWDGPVGFVTEPLARLRPDPDRTIAFLCGPEPMMRFCARALLARAIPAERIRVSLERNMQCGVGVCGHCQLGPVLLCRDGPVLDYRTAGPLLATREL